MMPAALEPVAGPWKSEPVEEVIRHLLERAGRPMARPLIVAVDGRGGAGKTTLAHRLQDAAPASAVVHTDDLAWHHSFFGWEELLHHDILTPLRRGEGINYRPPAWKRLGRAGSIFVPPGLDAVWIEGTGASRRKLFHLFDASIWVRSEKTEAERRLLARDGPLKEPLRQEWEMEEVPFLLEDQPWQRASLIVAGTPVAGQLHENQILVATPPG